MDWAPTYPNIIVCAQNAPVCRIQNSNLLLVVAVKPAPTELGYVCRIAYALPAIYKVVKFSPSITRWGLINANNLAFTQQKPSYFYSSWAFVFSEA